jgi:cobalamin-independent methionine synthase catalytic subunit
MKLELPVGAATGIGSLPGTDIGEAVAFTFGELPDFPYLPELPARGPGADMIGRGAALLVDIPVELYAGRWQVARRGGADLRRGRDLLDRDLDALTEAGEGFGGTLKIQAAGPWTLSVGLGLLKDHGFVRELSQSLAEGLMTHVDEVRRRVPGAQVVLQIDEPSVPTVLAGRVPTESGLHTYRAVDAAVVRSHLTSIVDGVGTPVIIHCCASDAPVGLFAEVGAAGIALDISLASLDSLGTAIDGGMALFAGVPGHNDKDITARLRRLWSELSFPAEMLPSRVVVTPACGLAGYSSAQATAILKACRDAALRLQEF